MPVPVPDEPADDSPSATTLPDGVRSRIVGFAAHRLGTMPAEEVPAPLRHIARFTPSRRARLGATAIVRVLDADPDFRAAVVDEVRARSPELVAAVAAGNRPDHASAHDVAAVAYLLRPEGWAALLDRALQDVRRAAKTARAEDAERRLAAVQEQAKRAQASARDEVAAMRAELDDVRAEVRRLRRELAEARSAAGVAERRALAAEEAEERQRRDAELAARESDRQLRRVRGRLAAAEAAAEASRRSARAGRAEADVRVWLLVETLARAVAGLREELALAPPPDRPADVVAEASPSPEPFAGTPWGALGADEPAVLDELLALPMAHLIVDGYNVTKSGFPALPLQAQRSRLLTGLAAVAARTGAEVTCVFDGGERAAPLTPAPRGVRVVFSGPDLIADDVIRRLVGAEPAGRPVVVVSSDREVADDVRRAGAWPLAAMALLRRLERA